MILRDHDGAFRGGAVTFFPGISDPEISEVLAARRALQLPLELGIQKIHLELDSKGVVSMLKDKSKNLSALGPYVEEVKEMFQTRRDYRITWARRTANSAAHVLAREGVSNEMSMVWAEVPPDCILHIVADEIPDVV